MFVERKKLNGSSIILLIVVNLLPTVCILGSIWSVAQGIVLTRNIIIGFLAVPCAVLLGNCLILCSNKKKLIKRVLCIVLFLTFFFSMLISSMGMILYKQSVVGEEVFEYYEDFSENSDFSEFFLSLEELGKMKTMEYYHMYASLFIFSTDTDYVICQYNAEEYVKQKEKVNKFYDFQKEPIYDDENRCEPEVTLDGYHFRLLNVEGTLDIIDYPKYMAYIGMNDETFEIIYMSVSDGDLDYISSLENLFNGEYGWEYIR